MSISIINHLQGHKTTLELRQDLDVARANQRSAREAVQAAPLGTEKWMRLLDEWHEASNKHDAAFDAYIARVRLDIWTDETELAQSS